MNFLFSPHAALLALCDPASQPFFLSLDVPHSPTALGLCVCVDFCLEYLSPKPCSFESLKPQLKYHLLGETFPDHTTPK